MTENPNRPGQNPDGKASEPAFDYETLIAGSADVNVVMEADGLIRYASSASHRLFGWDPHDVEGRHLEELVHVDDLASFHEGMAELEEEPFVTSTFRLLCRDHSYRWTETTSRRVRTDGRTVVVATVRDISERHEHMLLLQEQARADPLTGVANRTVLMDRLEQGLRRLERSGRLLAVLYLDLDEFKVVNDGLGHRVGDSVLLQMAERLTRHLRPNDTLARLGGDEFVIVAEGIPDERDAVELAERIIEAGREPFSVADERFVCTTSVGISLTGDARRSAQEMLREADLALYRAKNRGRDRAEVFDEALRTRAVGRLATERLVHRAIEEDRLVVLYQPVIDLRTGRPVAAEALIRIADQDRGLLEPPSFLDVALGTGLLVDIDAYVLASAVRQAASWRQGSGGDDGVEVAINVTPRHLAEAAFPATVLERLDAHGVPHHQLLVEVTEQVLMEASKSAMTGLSALRDAGVQVGLDDFGTGYSSLAYLQRFPLDFVKIDGSFVRDVDRDAGGREVVAAIVALAHALDLKVVAEAVETQSQREALETLQCDRAQGFLFSPAIRPDLLSEMLGHEA